jgi:hypothetical protein
MLAFNVTICRRLVCGAFFLSVSAYVSANASDPAEATVDIQLIKETPPEGGIAYRYEKGDCSISLSINPISPGNEGAAISGAYCRPLSYAEKLVVMASMLEKVKRDGELKNLRRVGPGPGDELCKGDVRKRLIKVTLDRLSDREFVRSHPELVAGKQRNSLNPKYVFEEADAFREYKEIFERLGYNLEIDEIEGVVFDKVKSEELATKVKGPPREIGIPCIAMVYFRVQQKR